MTSKGLFSSYIAVILSFFMNRSSGLILSSLSEAKYLYDQGKKEH